MRINAVASLRLAGGVRAGSVVRVGDVLVVLSGSAGGPAAAAGLRIDATRQDASRLWELELPAPPCDFGALALPGVVAPPGSSSVLLVCADRRIIVDVTDGRVIAESAGRPGSRGVPGASAEGALVPEGERLSCYDWSSAAVRWEQHAPAGMLFDACGSRLCALNADVGKHPPAWPPSAVRLPPSGVWEPRTAKLLVVPGSHVIRTAPLIAGDIGLVCFGGGAADRIVAFDADSGTVIWSEDCRPGIPGHASIQPIAPSLVLAGDRVVAATSRPSVELRQVADGAPLWTRELCGPGETASGTQPTALAVHDGVVWVSTITRTLLALDRATGELLSAQRLPPERFETGPAAIVTAGESGTGSADVWAVTVAGEVYAARL